MSRTMEIVWKVTECKGGKSIKLGEARSHKSLDVYTVYTANPWVNHGTVKTADEAKQFCIDNEVIKKCNQ